MSGHICSAVVMLGLQFGWSFVNLVFKDQTTTGRVVDMLFIALCASGLWGIWQVVS